jgi:hypothetical protein
MCTVSESNADDAAHAFNNFDNLAPVLTHPRCLNCHTQYDAPRVGDEGRAHQPPVRRGMENQGVAGMRCTGCHRLRNNEASGVPGAPNWQLPRPSMGWDDRSPAEICRSLKDPARNGERTLPDIVMHMKEDPLVLWAWQPGKRRAPPPMAHPEFVALVEDWVAHGAPCADE